MLCWWEPYRCDAWGHRQAHGQRNDDNLIKFRCVRARLEKEDGLWKVTAKLENIWGGLVTLDQRCPFQEGKELKHTLVMGTISS